MKLLRGALYTAGWLAVMLIGCSILVRWFELRPMPKIVFERRVPYGIEYNAQDEAFLDSGQPVPALLRSGMEMSRRLSPTLSQPVGITQWRGDSPTWEIFFATNRGLIPTTAGSEQQRFGNAVLEEAPHYGRAAIALPFRRRGVDPPREVSAGSQASAGSNENQRIVVSFDEVRAVPWEEMIAGVNRQIARSRQQDLLLFVHGFNVDFESALIRTAQLGLDIPFNGAVVAYSWPSQGGILNYPIDESINAKSVRPFSEFLQRLVEAVPSGTRINIVVHSMGNRLVVKAVGQLPRSSSKPIANLALCAPDVGVADFTKWAPAVTARCEHVTLYASQSDSALIGSKHINGDQRAGDAYPPLCLPNIDTIDVTGVDFDLLLGHSYYGSNRNVLSDLYFVVKEHRPPAERKYLSRTTIGSTGKSYWEFRDQAPYIRCSWMFGEEVTR